MSVKIRGSRTSFYAIASIVAVLAFTGISHAQVVDENFDTVTGVGGGPFINGSGFQLINDWDSGITGESAFAGTAGNAGFGSVAASGVPGGGLTGGGGRVSVSGVTYNLLDQPFTNVTGVGGGVFLAGDGVTPDTFNFTTNFDTGITGEGAFGGTAGGAVLSGSMSASGLTSGGVSGGAGAVTVSNVTLNSGSWYAGIQFDVNPFPGASALGNPSFEGGAGANFPSWNTFANCYSEAIAPRTGTHVAKMFGAFPGPSGIYQDLPTIPGQIWELDVWSRHQVTDNLIGTGNTLIMAIEFRDGNGGLISATPQQTILSAASPTAVWIDNTPIQATAPANAATARALFMFVQSGVQGGAAYVDDASFKVVGGPNPVSLNNFSLTTAVKGTANGGNGEVLGAVQLRLEDSDGDRLAFHSVATGAFQTLGGVLSTAVEENANGVPASGVFDITSPSFRVVIAFDNDAANDWGTGGTLTIDNVLLSNSDSTGSAWYAGLFWDGLAADLSDPSQYELRADVKGSVVGGKYALRLEAFRLLEAGLDDDFESATGDGADVLLDAAGLANGQDFGFTTDYDTGLSNDGAFGGVFGLVDILEDGGIYAESILSGGNPGKAGRIRVENIAFGVNAGWYGGLDFGEQALASQDLSQIVLTATIKGEIPPSGGALGTYELRIEDAQGDRLYFPATADGNWQTIGGPLSTALEGGRLGGGGDGNFDLDSTNYHVVVSFTDPQNTWFFGGILTVDNIFLTPATVGQQLGAVTFTGTSNGAFQSVGGNLTAGDTNLGDFVQDFSSGTGVGGGAFGNGSGNWDDGIVNENAFYGTYGDAVTVVGASAQVCATCGVSGGKAADLVVGNVSQTTGGWYTGLFFTDVPARISDLSQVELSADIKGIADTNAGQTLGTFFIRIEDADRTVLSFTYTATGSFQHVGGLLSTATLEQIDAGDGIFNLNQPTYTITMGTVGNSGNWGSGCRLIVDNIFLTGVQLSDADAYTVTLTYADEIATWGAGGDLTLDNLYFGPANTVLLGDMNCDSVVNLTDLPLFAQALVDPAGYQAGAGQTCQIEKADMNQDAVNNGSDIAGFVDALINP